MLADQSFYLYLFIGLCLVSGVFAGLTSGLLGLGGGLVIIPILNFLIPLVYTEVSDVHVISIQTSFAVIVFTTGISAYKQIKLQNVDFSTVLIVAPMLMIFSAISGRLAVGSNPGYLKILFSTVLIFSSWKMLKKKNKAKFVEDPKAKISVPRGIIAGAAIGAISGTAGISGGSFLGPLFRTNKFPIKRALGTSSACGFLLAISSFTTYFVSGFGVNTGMPYSIGYLSFIAFGAFVITSIIFASYGVKLQSVLPPAKVEKFFGLFLLVVAADMIISGASAIMG